MWSNILRNVPKIKNTSRVVCDFRDAKGGGNTGNALIEGILLYLQLTSETAEKGAKILEHAFQRKEIERMLCCRRRN